MAFHNRKKNVSRALMFAFVMALSVPVYSQSMAEMSLILGLVGNSTQATFELCGSNVSMEPQTATFDFMPTSPYVSPVPIELELDPNETECQTFTPTVAGVLSERIEIPEDILMNGQAEGNTRILPLKNLKELVAFRNRRIVTQVWLTDNGRRTAPVQVANDFRLIKSRSGHILDVD